MLQERRSSCALVISLVAHVAVLATTAAVAASELAEAGRGGMAFTGLSLDGNMVDEVLAASGGGDTFEIDGLVYDETSSAAPGDLVASDPDDGQPHDREDEPAPPAPPAKPVEPPAEPAPTVPAVEPAPPAPKPAASYAPSAVARQDASHERDHAPPTRADSRGSRARRGEDSTGAAPRDEARDGDGQGARRVWGAAGARRGIRPLARDFARAVPAAVSADRAWSKLPVGEVGAIEITVVVDRDGAIESVRVPDKAPAPLRRLVTRTMALLQAGRFALASTKGAGEEILRIEVALSQRDPIEGAGGEPHHALNLGHDPPAPGQPGKAYFTLASGRHFEAAITIVSSKGRQPVESTGGPRDAGADRDGAYGRAVAGDVFGSS